MKRCQVVLAALAVAMMMAVLSVSASAGFYLDPDNYYLSVGKYDPISNGFTTLPQDEGGRGYVAHVGDIIAAGVFRKVQLDYDYSYTRISGPESLVDDSGGYKMSFTPVTVSYGRQALRCDNTGIALFHASVFVSNPFDVNTCPQNIGLSTAIRVIPALPLKPSLYGPVKVSTGYLVEFSIANIGKTTINGPDIMYTTTSGGIRWKFSASGLNGPWDSVDQALSFTHYSIVQCWVKYAGESKWMLYGNAVGPDQVWGMGNLEPGKEVGVQLVLKPFPVKIAYQLFKNVGSFSSPIWQLSSTVDSPATIPFGSAVSPVVIDANGKTVSVSQWNITNFNGIHSTWVPNGLPWIVPEYYGTWEFQTTAVVDGKSYSLNGELTINAPN